VVNSQQRGIVVHHTHQALVSDNVMFAVRGAGLYVEEGVEMDNEFIDNVYLCDQARLPDMWWNPVANQWEYGPNKCAEYGSAPGKRAARRRNVRGGRIGARRRGN